MFTWTEHDLNREQTEAVLLPESLFLIACPGSGKTRTLTYKIAYELSRLESSRQFVVAITYTHRAADEIQERIESMGVNTDQLWIGTIHSFCLEWIIKPYAIYEPKLAHGYSIIDLHEREKILEDLCTPYKDKKITHWDCDYYFTHKGFVLACSDQNKRPAIANILKEYFRHLLKNKQIDFELILHFACKLIGKYPPISVNLSKIFSIILVDEYQDTKEIQYAIITYILRAGVGKTRLFMVGDPNQAIYSSLGGYPITIHQLRELSGIHIEEKELSFNYRSSSRIIEYFGNFNIHNTNIEAAGNIRDYPSLISYNDFINKDDLVDEIVKLIQHNVGKLSIPPNQICIIAPQWFHLATMTRKLVVRMPQHQFDGPGMVPFARDIENFWYKLSRIALTEPLPTMFVRRLRWAGEILNDLKDAGIDISKLSRRFFLRECNSITINESHGLAFLRQFFDSLFLRIDIPYQNFTQLEKAHQAFFAASEARILRIEKEGLDGIRDINFFKKVFQNRSGITVSTIHGVKGAEFDVVIAYALLDGIVPHFNDNDSNASARKLLYVIGSRAKKNLHLFSEAGRNRGRFNFYQPTQQLQSCAFDYDEVYPT